MQVVKKTADYRILKRRDNRYAVRDAEGRPVNGDDKVAILKAEGLIAVAEPKAPEPEPEEEAGAEESASEEASSEEAADEESGEKE